MHTKRIDTLLLSVPQMDHDHSILIAQEDAFFAAVKANAPQAELFVRVTQLVEAFRDHFDCEENMMRSSGFRCWRRHASEHLTLVEQMSWLRDDLKAGTLRQVGSMVLCLRDWTEQHILRADKDFADYLCRGSEPNRLFAIAR